MKIAIAIKYVGQHSQAKDYRLPQHDWEFGETKIVNNEEGNELLKNPDFIIADEVVLKKLNKKEQLLKDINNATNIQELRNVAKQNNLKAKDTTFAELKNELTKEVN